MLDLQHLKDLYAKALDNPTDLANPWLDFDEAACNAFPAIVEEIERLREHDGFVTAEQHSRVMGEYVKQGEELTSLREEMSKLEAYNQQLRDDVIDLEVANKGFVASHEKWMDLLGSKISAYRQAIEELRGMRLNPLLMPLPACKAVQEKRDAILSALDAKLKDV